MSYSNTGVHPFPGAIVSLVLIMVLTLFAGQALCLAEDEVQSVRVEQSGTSMPPAAAGVSSEAANRAILGQRYIGLYEGDTFVGDEGVTREQLLIILDRVIRDIEDGKILVESSDAQMLRELMTDIKDEIVGLNYQLEVLEAEMQERHKRDVVLTEQTLEVKEEVNDLMDDLTRFAEDLRQFVLDQAASNTEQLDAADSRVDLIEEQISQIILEVQRLQTSLKASTTDLGKSIDELRFEADVLSSRFSALKTDTGDVYRDLTSRIDALETQLAEKSSEQAQAEETIKAQQQRISELERQLVIVQSQYEEDLKSLSDRILTLSARLSALESRSRNSSSGEMSALTEATDELRRETSIMKAFLALTALLGIQ